MSRKTLLLTALIFLSCGLLGCSRYNPDCTIWREALVTGYDIQDGYIDITVNEAYNTNAYSFDEVYDVSSDISDAADEEYLVCDAVYYGDGGLQMYTQYTIVNSQLTYRIEAEQIDNFEEMCDSIKSAEYEDKVVRLTIINGSVTAAVETGYIVYNADFV